MPIARSRFAQPSPSSAPKKLFAAAVVLVLFPLLAWGWYAHALSAPSSDPTETVIVKVPSGSTLKDVATILEDQGVIRSSFAFGVHARLRGLETGLQAGSFALKPSRGASEILADLSGEGRGEAVVTIPEGYTVKDIDALMADAGLLPAGAILDCARTCAFAEHAFLPEAGSFAPRAGRIEGYLYPDTYFVLSEGLTAESFLSRLLDTFEERVVDAKKDDIAASKRSLHQIVTMASLIEEETRTDAERPVVAGILWKRFDAGAGLGVDAAVRYIIDKPTAAITVGDLNVDSPYNLRKFRGLPPGPIANAGIDSVNAALKPEASPYYYYLHGSDGQIRYAVTNEEHNLNRIRYLE
jgi:UPF0755 protein